MRSLLLFCLALLMVGCGSPGDELIRLCASDDYGETLRAQQMLKDQPDLVSYTDSKGRTPLHAAAGAFNYGLVNPLLTAKALVNVQDKNGDTPLHLAVRSVSDGDSSAKKQRAEQYRASIVKLLLSAGANPKLNNLSGHSPLEDSPEVKEIYESYR